MEKYHISSDEIYMNRFRLLKNSWHADWKQKNLVTKFCVCKIVSDVYLQNTNSRLLVIFY